MQASETKLRQLIEGTKQYVVPLFQRPYSWSEKQWKTLWNDAREKARHGDGRPHFFGSIVTAPAKSVPQGVGKFALIDGQQRLTTIQVLLAAIRDTIDPDDETQLRGRIEDLYLTNSYQRGDERLKVLPTQDDRPAFRAIVEKSPAPSGRLRDCYLYFRSRLSKLSPDELDSLHLAVVDRFSLVSITCDEQDNPHLIFESLNAKGEKLTPADLIRNFLLMQVHVGEQDRVFQQYWLPIQQALDHHLTEFVRHYLMKEGKILREAEIYFELKDRLAGASPAEAESFLKDLHRHGNFYAKLVNAGAETDPEIAERLDRVRRLKVTVAYPLLLRVLDAFDAGGLTRDQVLETLDVLESFVVRRSVYGLQSNQLRRMLPPVFDAVGGASPEFVAELRRKLGGKRCPTDSDFTAALATAPLYATAEKNARLRLILERLERSFRHKEPADLSKATIEHVMPQTLTPAWRESLGPDGLDQWDRLVHTLGNLTLSAYNAELSNGPYEEKRSALLKSHFDLNQYFKDIERWTPESIRQRSKALTDRALGLWPDVGRASDVDGVKKQSSRPPVAVRFGTTREPCRNWRDGFVKLIRLFESAKPGLLARIADDQSLPGVVSRDAKRFQRAKAQIGDMLVNTNLTVAQIKDWCHKIASLAGFDPGDYEFIPPSESGG